MFEKVEFEIAGAEVLAKPPRMPEHPEVTVRDLCDTAVRPRPEHIRRNERGLCRLHGFVTQDPRLPVVPDVRDIFQFDAGVIEAELYRLVWKSAVMFLAGEALFFDRGDQFTIADQSGGGIAEGREAENVHT
jgi:hypothetical protein